MKIIKILLIVVILVILSTIVKKSHMDEEPKVEEQDSVVLREGGNIKSIKSRMEVNEKGQKVFTKMRA